MTNVHGIVRSDMTSLTMGHRRPVFPSTPSENLSMVSVAVYEDWWLGSDLEAMAPSSLRLDFEKLFLVMRFFFYLGLSFLPFMTSCITFYNLVCSLQFLLNCFIFDVSLASLKGRVSLVRVLHVVGLQETTNDAYSWIVILLVSCICHHMWSKDIIPPEFSPEGKLHYHREAPSARSFRSRSLRHRRRGINSHLERHRRLTAF